MTPDHKEVLEHLWACRKAAGGETGSPENTIYLDGYVAGLNQALTRLTPSHVNDMHEWAARQRDTECACEHWVAWECQDCDGECMCHQRAYANLEKVEGTEATDLVDELPPVPPLEQENTDENG